MVIAFHQFFQHTTLPLNVFHIQQLTFGTIRQFSPVINTSVLTQLKTKALNFFFLISILTSVRGLCSINHISAQVALKNTGLIQ